MSAAAVSIDYPAFEKVPGFRSVTFNEDQYASLIDEMRLPENQWQLLSVNLRPHIHMIEGMWRSMFHMAIGTQVPASYYRLGHAEADEGGNMKIDVWWHSLRNASKTLIHETCHGVEMLTYEDGPDACLLDYKKQREHRLNRGSLGSIALGVGAGLGTTNPLIGLGAGIVSELLAYDFSYARLPQERRARAAERKYLDRYGDIIRVQVG